MASTQERVVALITQTPEERSIQAMETVLPWLQRRSQKLMDMERETLMEILQNCSYEKAAKDDIIVKQGEKGDKFYIIISGRTSVYIDVTKSDDDPFEERGYQRPKLLVKSAQSDAALEHAGKGAKRNKTSSRDVLGKFISHLETGKTFGEIALLSTDAIRNATVVADEDTDLLVINRILFNRCVKAKEEAIYKEKVEFVSQHKLFRSWSVKLRRLLEMSLKKEVCPQGTVLMRQGQPPPGLIFILSGVAQVCMEPLHHEEQFPELWAPVGSVRSKNQVPSGWRPGSTRNKTTPQVAVRRRQGYAAAERRMMGRRVNLCCVGPNDILGDAEMALGLEKSTATVTVEEDAHVIILNAKNYERLVLRKNMQTARDLTQVVCQKLEARLESPLAPQVPIIQRLHVAAVALGRHLAGTNVRQGRRVRGKGQVRRERDVEKTLLRLFQDGHAPLIKPLLSDSLKYRAASLARMKILASSFGRAWTLRMSTSKPNQRRRKIPRSKAQLRNDLEAQRLLLGRPATPPEVECRKEDVTSATSAAARPASSTEAPCDISVAKQVTSIRPQSAGELWAPSGEGSVDTTPIVRLKSANVIVRDSVKAVRHDAGGTVLQELTAVHQASKDSRLHIVCACSSARSQGNAEHATSVVQNDDEDSKDGFYDLETSDKQLRDLEERIATFCSSLSPLPLFSHSAPPRHRPQVMELKRFEVQGSAAMPVPGGVVFVHCKPRRALPSHALVEDASSDVPATSSDVPATSSHPHVRRVMLQRRMSSL